MPAACANGEPAAGTDRATDICALDNGPDPLAKREPRRAKVSLEVRARAGRPGRNAITEHLLTRSGRWLTLRMFGMLPTSYFEEER